MAINSISTLLTSKSIQPKKGRISYSFVSGDYEVSSLVKQNIRHIFSNLLSPLVTARFVETTQAADINFWLHDFEDYYAYELESDIFLQRSYDNAITKNGFQSGVGSHGFMSIMHEIMHALGFKHPGNYNDSDVDFGPFLPYELDNTTNTVLSYNFAGTGAASLMPYDVEAIRYVYGKRGLNAGRTHYSFSTISSFTDGKRTWGDTQNDSKLTLIDDGGFDKVDFSQLKSLASGYLLDARVGGIFTTNDAYNAVAYIPNDRLVDAPLEQTTSNYGTRVGFKTQIESIVGSRSDDLIVAGKKTRTIAAGAGNDTVYGRDRQNDITGGRGNDYIAGGQKNDRLAGEAGNDTLYGGAGRDSLTGGVGNDTLFGQNGSDSLVGGEGNDALFGTDGSLSWEMDELTGGGGHDRFILGTAEQIFYRGKGHAIIKDFQAGIDQIQLSLGSDQYTLKALSPKESSVFNTHLYYKKNLIAVIESVEVQTLNSRDFAFV